MAKSYRNVCIRATCTNSTKKGIVTYDVQKIQGIIENWASIEEYEYILHNQGKDAEQPHIHIVLRLKNATPKENIISKFPYCNIEGIHSSYAKCVQYLVHENDKEKVQYARESIVTNFKNLDKYFLKSGKEEDAEIENVITKINDGEIQEYELTKHVDIALYSKYKTRINNAFEYYYRKLEENKSRKINVMFYHGKSGTGKSSYAKMFCEKSGKSYCVSSSSNDPMQDYRGEDVLILDDLRDTVFEFDDLLKILDNHTKSSVKSRYRNKVFAGDTIIITSTVDLKDWYTWCCWEEKKQLKRRCGQLFKFYDNEVTLYEYIEKDDKYFEIATLKNPIYDMYRKEQELIGQNTLSICMQLEDM